MNKRGLQQLRKKIDRIDGEILCLLNERTTCVQEVGRIKETSGQKIFAPDREEMLLRRLEKENKGPLTRDELRAIYGEIISTSRARQKLLTLAYLGPNGSYCHEATLKRFGGSNAYVPCHNIHEILAVVYRNEADLAVVPIENSTEGGVNAAHDALIHTDLSICGEIYLPINHLLATKGTSKKIHTLYSHPQGFAQCRQWITSRYPSVEIVELASTSASAKRAAKTSGTAAICSEVSARMYGLKVLSRNIQDFAHNHTRFLILGHEMPAPTGSDKTSLLFAIPHRFGSLNHVLDIFTRNRLNLEKIESRPSRQGTWEYLFFVDIKGHSQEKEIGEAINQVRKKTLWLKILGSYPLVTQNF